MPVKGRQVPLRMMDYWYQDTAGAELFQLPDESQKVSNRMV